jgi:hypothetical protein
MMTVRLAASFGGGALKAGSKAGLGRTAYGLMAAVLMLAALGTMVVVRQIDHQTHPYFPETILEDPDVINKPRVGAGPVLVNVIEEDWYPGIWRGLREPSLYLQSREPAGEVMRTVRFSCFRSFDPAMVVRLDWLRTGEVRMTAKRRATGLDGGADATRVRLLSSNEIDRLEATLASTAILEQTPVDHNYGGTDGSNWIVESARPGEYRYINRWSPSEDAPASYQQMRQAGLFMLGLTGWSLDPIY